MLLWLHVALAACPEDGWPGYSVWQPVDLLVKATPNATLAVLSRPPHLDMVQHASALLAFKPHYVDCVELAAFACHLQKSWNRTISLCKPLYAEYRLMSHDRRVNIRKCTEDHPLRFRHDYNYGRDSPQIEKQCAQKLTPHLTCIGIEMLLKAHGNHTKHLLSFWETNPCDTIE